MEIKTREEAQTIVDEIAAEAEHRWHNSEIPYQPFITETCQRILDALFPKPESERLRQLREDKKELDSWRPVMGDGLIELTPQHNRASMLDDFLKDNAIYDRLGALIDAAIKEEESKS